MQSEGLRREFAAFYENNRDKIFNYVRARNFPYNHTQDLVSKIFEIAWKRFSEYPGLTAERQPFWLYRIAENVCKYEKRKFWKVRESTVPDLVQAEYENLHSSTANHPPSLEQNVLDKELYEKFVATIATLPRRHREVFTLRSAGLTYQEIAQNLGISAQAAQTRMERALKKHKAILYELLQDIKSGL